MLCQIQHKQFCLFLEFLKGEHVYGILHRVSRYHQPIISGRIRALEIACQQDLHIELLDRVERIPFQFLKNSNFGFSVTMIFEVHNALGMSSCSSLETVEIYERGGGRAKAAQRVRAW